MASRKSTTRRSSVHAPAAQGSSPVATSSKVRLDMIPAFDVAMSVTPNYQPQAVERPPLDEEDRQRLIYELTGVRPRGFLESFTEDARLEIYSASEAVEGWARKVTSDDDEALDREINIGVHQLETLLESHMDKALDKFTAWSLRNPFDVPPGVEPVLPWHRGLDFERGEYVSTLPQGEETVRATIEALRVEVEQARYLCQQLETADKAIDRRLDIARQRKAEVGFIQELLAASEMTNLPETAAEMLKSLNKLHGVISPLNASAPAVALQGTGTKAWELGRQAYLNWAVGKMLSQAASSGGNASEAAAQPPHAGTAEDRVETVEAELQQVGNPEDLEAVKKAVGS